MSGNAKFRCLFLVFFFIVITSSSGCMTLPVSGYLGESKEKFLGRATGYVTRTGNLNITTISGIKCEGDFVYETSSNGKGDFKCADGQFGDFLFTSNGNQGEGFGKTNKGEPFFFQFGNHFHGGPSQKTNKRIAEANRQEQTQGKKESTFRKEQTPQSGTGSGFFISKMGHVIANARVVKNCKKVTIGDNANKQVPAEIINTDRSNDLALLKLSTLEMASAESKSLIQKLGITVVPLASKGLLRNEDVRLGEKVLVAGYPFGELFSNTIKVTSGIVSATRGAGDDSGQFQLDAAVQPGNSGGPIYDSGGNIVGVVISQLDKLKMAKAIGSLPENVNFGIKASTVRQFLISSGLPSKKSERIEEKSTEQLAEIAKNQALMVMCLQ